MTTFGFFVNANNKSGNKYKDRLEKFEAGIEVFDIRYGWGIVSPMYRKGDKGLIVIYNANEVTERIVLYTRENLMLVSTKEYRFEEIDADLEDEVEEINLEEYLGKYGKLYDSNGEFLYVAILNDTLKNLIEATREDEVPFKFVPLSEESSKLFVNNILK